MRLLQRNDAGDYILTEFIGDNIPHYAILSHTWGADDEEVTLEDLRNGISKSKAGYTKLQFCADRATRDNLRYFWVDTCCIDRSSSAELSEAVNSMFAWYRNAARCYVYLSDVATGSLTNAAPAQQDWHLAFQQSRWFTRGWTIQELVAPASVEFFSIEGHRLGDKNSLIQELHSITGIGVEALRGRPLVEFSVDERMSWVEQRHTRRAEDAAYSLLGIFDVYMPILYGEGRNRAFARLRKEIQAWNSDTSHPGPIHDVNFKTHHEGHVDSPLTTTDLNLEVVATPYSDSDDGSEIVSVFSDGETSISSASTANLNPVQTVGIREVSRALLSKQDVKAIYSMAIFNVERRKARSHIRGFLKDYGRNLLKEASSSSLAIQAAKFVHELAGRISDEIIWNITGSAALPDSPKSGFKKRGLETWLSTLQSEGIGIDESNPTGTRADGDEISEEGESDEELNNDLPFPNIDKVKDFLLNSEAFQEHIMAMRTWLKVDGVDRKDVNKSATDTAEHINTEELTKEILEDLNVSMESQQQIGHRGNAPVEIETHQQQDTAQGQEPRTRSRQHHRSVGDLVSGLLNFWGISFFFYDLVELFIPHVPRGYRRLRWRCSCNTILWGDFSVEDDAAFDRLKRELFCLEDPPTQQAPSSGTSRTHVNLDSGTRGPESVPVQQTFPASPSPGLSNILPAQSGIGNPSSVVDAVPSGSDHVVDIVFPPGYFEVCVSTGNHAIDHHEIDISRMTSDSELFELIWDKYNLSRGIGLRRLFLRPSDVNFVMFSISRRNQYGAGIHKKPDEFPPQRELDRKRYHYLCPQIRMPANVFLHYLHRARWTIWGEHRENTWLQRLPKKLNRSLLIEALQNDQQEEDDALMDPDLAFGWGIHIIDGPNHAVLGLLLAIGVAVAFVVSGMVVGFAKTQEQGFGVGNFLLAILASIIVAVYFQLQD